MTFEDIINLLKNPIVLTVICAVGLLIIILAIISIVKSVKLSRAKKEIKSLKADNGILAIDRDTFSKGLDSSRENCNALSEKLEKETKARESAEKSVADLKKSSTEKDLRIKALSDENTSMGEEIISLSKQIDSLSNEIKSLNEKISELTPAPVMLEPEVTPTEVNKEESATTEARPVFSPSKKTGMFKYTLDILNQIAEALGLSKKKTKAEVSTMIKYILIDKKVTKAQLLAAMAIIGLTPNSSDTKDTLIEQFRKELMK